MSPSSTNAQILRLRDTVSDGEWAVRTNLAAAFRVAFHLGWNNHINNHISCRIPDAPSHFLMNPQGLGWHEITASNLVTADFDGRILSHQGSNVKLAPAGYNFHSGILKARTDLACVIHVHATPVVVVSATQEGLMVVDQSSCHLYGEVGYHDFEGYAQEEDEVPRILRDLGDKRILMMWNHGALSVGRTIGEAFSYMRKLVDACDLQVKLLSTGSEVREIPEEVLEFTRAQIAKKMQTKPFYENEWDMYRRIAENLYPDSLI